MKNLFNFQTSRYINYINILILFFSILVILIIYYFQLNQNIKNICFFDNNDCLNIWQTKYSKFLNVDWLIWGLFFSIFLILLNIFELIFKKKIKFINLFYLIGCLIAFYLIFLQIFIIKKLCFYCLIYDVLIIILFFLNSKIFYFLLKLIKK